MSSLRSLIKPTALCGVVASLAVLAGCGSSGGGGSSPTTSYTGTGGEALGTWVLVVTNATGVYQDKHFAPKGLSVGVQIEQTGNNIEIHQDLENYSSRWITLYADAPTHTYVGALEYGYYASDTMYDHEIYEKWTLTPSADGITLNVTGHTTDWNTYQSSDLGTLTATLKPVVGYINSLSSDWLSVSSKSDQPLMNGEGGIYEEYNQSPGTYAYYYWDAAWDWESYLYIDQMYRDGNVLRGGGWYDGSFADDYKSTFGTIEVALDANNHPISSTAKLIEGYGAGATTATISHPHYENAETLGYRFDHTGTSHNVHVDTVTAGGLLESHFGIAGSTAGTMHMYSGGYFEANFSYFGWLTAGKINGDSVTWTVFPEDNYLFYAPDYPGYDFDSDFGTMERDIITLNFDATTKAPIGGTWTLEVYNPVKTLIRTETMTFSTP